MSNIEETKRGTYKEPFVLRQYGAFVKSDGDWSFVSVSVVSASDAKEKARRYCRDMAQYPQNNMDLSALDDIQIRVRAVTYSPWEVIQ